MNSRKAQGLSMTTIVIAALSLLVLVVLVLIFTGRMGLFSGGVEDSSKCLSFCGSANKSMDDSLANDAGGKDSCRAKDGNIIPGITGADKTKLCCCY